MKPTQANLTRVLRRAGHTKSSRGGARGFYYEFSPEGINVRHQGDGWADALGDYYSALARAHIACQIYYRQARVWVPADERWPAQTVAEYLADRLSLLEEVRRG